MRRRSWEGLYGPLWPGGPEVAWRTFPYEIGKAALDRLLAFMALLVLLPFLAAISLVVMVDSPGSPIFAQPRVGKDGRRFILLKFRSMEANSDDREYKAYIERYVKEGAPYKEDPAGPVFKLVDDRRATRVGALLRRLDLDELPQLINILKGDMSLVGPRPDIPEAVAMYEDWHKGRLAVTPGLTGPWQVNGRDRTPFDEMVRIDLDYIHRRSLGLDLKIILLTIPSVVKRALRQREE